MKLLFGIQYSKQNCCGFEGGDREGGVGGGEDGGEGYACTCVIHFYLCCILQYCIIRGRGGEGVRSPGSSVG